MYKSRKELKALARTQMQGKYKTLIGALVLQEIIIFLLQSVLISLFPSNSLPDNIIYFIASFALSAFLGTITAGITYISMAVACGMPCRAGDIYRSFQDNPGKAVWLTLPVISIQTICTLPASIMELVTPTDAYMSQVGVILILSGLGMLVATILSLPFALAFYMYWDFPEYEAKYILKHSIELMKGNYWRFFALQLSFLPLFLMSVLSIGIGLLWVIPYMNVTCANFYLDLMSKRNKE